MIILVNPPNPPGKVSNKDMMGGLGQLYEPSGPKIPPLDIPYIAGCLKESNIAFTIIECLGLDYKQDTLLEEIKKNETDNLSVAIRTSLPTLSFDMEIAREIKQKTNATIIMFGPQVCLSGQEIIEEEFIDLVIMGEPEFIFVSIFTKGLQETQGIWFKNQTGQIIRNSPRAYLEDLNKLPLPLWELMPYKNYILPQPQFPDEKPFLPVATSRGCPFNCHYCPYPLTQGCQWRIRSIENVVAELTYIVDKLGITNILFRDPEFSLDRVRTKKLCQRIIEKELRFFWRCETRIDTLDEDLIEIMAGAGCRGMNVGIESLSDKTLKSLGRKGVAEEQAERIMACCQKYNINTFCFFIIGLPGENKRDIRKSIQFARKIDPVQVQFTFATPYPKTALAQWADEKGFIEDRDFSHYTGYTPVMRNEYLTISRVKKIHDFANRWVSLRKNQKEQRIQKMGFLQRIKEPIKEVLLWFQQWFI